VLTGIASREEAETSDVRPTYLAEDLRSLFTDPEPASGRGDRARAGA
jgi:ribonucleotide monophosphatase NagD (HAD superfamily)